MRRLLLSFVVLFALPASGPAQETGDVAIAENDAPIVRSFKAGVALMRQADVEESAEMKIAGYQAAANRFDAVLQETPDLYAAHANAADCINQLAGLTADAAARQALVVAAKRRYETASKLPAAEPRLYASWAAMLIRESNRPADFAQRQEVLEQAVQIVRTGLARASSKDDRALLVYQFGRAEVFQAQITAERGGRRSLYESALAHFKVAADASAIAKLPQLYASWGIALFELARLRNDRMLLRQAIERWQTALEVKADNQTVRYNLACAYALLGQPDNALRHLKTCLENDDASHTYLNAARKDPDLVSLRIDPEFNKLFGAQPIAPAGPFEKPILSDK